MNRASSHLMPFIMYMHQAAALTTRKHTHLLRTHALVANSMCFYTDLVAWFFLWQGLHLNSIVPACRCVCDWVSRRWVVAWCWRWVVTTGILRVALVWGVCLIGVGVCLRIYTGRTLQALIWVSSNRWSHRIGAGIVLQHQRLWVSMQHNELTSSVGKVDFVRHAQSS